MNFIDLFFRYGNVISTCMAIWTYKIRNKQGRPGQYKDSQSLSNFCVYKNV